jgi:hypothetical protein
MILDRWRVSAIYRSYRLSRSVTESTFKEPGGNHVHCRDDIGGDEHFPR